MIGWQSDKRWSDRFLPEIKRNLGEVLIGEPPVAEDQERNTDLIVLKMDAVRIACRVRRNKFISYKEEFTIRSGRPSGKKTELAKIIEGWGDYFFYGICDEEEKHLEFWLIGSLNAFRAWFSAELFSQRGFPPGRRHGNVDGSSCFYVYDWDDIPNFIVSSSDKAA